MTSPSALEIAHLLPELCREHYFRAQSLFTELGLCRGQPGILEELWRKDGCTQRELGAALHVQPATITKMLQRMESAGFVERRPDPDDARAQRVYLTEAGRGVQPQVERVWETLAAEALQDFAPEEQLLLRRFLVQMRDNLRRRNETGKYTVYK
jgi:DNA-binding MarR family transcriptional regulator